LTGISVRVGNFSILPRSYLGTLVVLAELWNHYAAAVFRSQLRFTMIPIPRGRRIAGTSRMNFVSLVTHGLSAVSVFADVVGVRLLIGSLAGSMIAAIGIVIVVVIRLFTNQAIPGWAHTIGTLIIILIQLVRLRRVSRSSCCRADQRPRVAAMPVICDEVINIYPHDWFKYVGSGLTYSRRYVTGSRTGRRKCGNSSGATCWKWVPGSGQHRYLNPENLGVCMPGT
jgi:hypothetical protein